MHPKGAVCTPTFQLTDKMSFNSCFQGVLSRDVAEEGEETRNKRETEEVEAKMFPGVQSALTDGRKTGLCREEGRRSKKRRDQEGRSPWVCEWRLSLGGANRGHRGGTAGAPPPLFSPLCTGP